MKINIIGWYGRGNCGDEAFKHAFDVLLPNHEKIFSTAAVPADLHILGGGDVIKPYYLDGISPETPLYIVGAGLGYEGDLDCLNGRNIKKALFRNPADVEMAKARGIDAAYIPDIVFSLSRPERLLPNKTEKKLAVVILNGAINPTAARKHKANETAYAEYFKWEMAESLSYLSEWYDFMFLPFSDDIYNRDDVIHCEVAARMAKPGRTQIMHFPHSPKVTLQTIADADLVIGMKFHSLIFSTIANVPFVNVGLSRKTGLFCKNNKLDNLSIEPFTFTKDRFEVAVKHAESLPEKALEDVAFVNRLQVNNVFDKFKDEFIK